jgi:hypothetical protein
MRPFDTTVGGLPLSTEMHSALRAVSGHEEAEAAAADYNYSVEEITDRIEAHGGFDRLELGKVPRKAKELLVDATVIASNQGLEALADLWLIVRGEKVYRQHETVVRRRTGGMHLVKREQAAP